LCSRDFPLFPSARAAGRARADAWRVRITAVGRTGTLAFRVAYDAYGEARHLPAKDIYGDGKVDRADTMLAQAASGKKLGQPGYNPDADWDRDGVVSTRDVAQFGSAPRTAAGWAALPANAFHDRDFLSHTP
jgi:hypothetical protein